jgi:hypothetical protein
LKIARSIVNVPNEEEEEEGEEEGRWLAVDDDAKLYFTCFLVLTTSKGVVTSAAKVPEPRPEIKDVIQSSDDVGLALLGKKRLSVKLLSHS